MLIVFVDPLRTHTAAPGSDEKKRKKNVLLESAMHHANRLGKGRNEQS